MSSTHLPPPQTRLTRHKLPYSSPSKQSAAALFRVIEVAFGKSIFSYWNKWQIKQRRFWCMMTCFNCVTSNLSNSSGQSGETEEMQCTSFPVIEHVFYNNIVKHISASVKSNNNNNNNSVHSMCVLYQFLDLKRRTSVSHQIQICW